MREISVIPLRDIVLTCSKIVTLIWIGDAEVALKWTRDVSSISKCVPLFGWKRDCTVVSNLIRWHFTTKDESDGSCWNREHKWLDQSARYTRGVAEAYTMYGWMWKGPVHSTCWSGAARRCVQNQDISNLLAVFVRQPEYVDAWILLTGRIVCNIAQTKNTLLLFFAFLFLSVKKMECSICYSKYGFTCGNAVARARWLCVCVCVQIFWHGPSLQGSAFARDSVPWHWVNHSLLPEWLTQRHMERCQIDFSVDGIYTVQNRDGHWIFQVLPGWHSPQCSFRTAYDAKAGHRLHWSWTCYAFCVVACPSLRRTICCYMQYVRLPPSYKPSIFHICRSLLMKELIVQSPTHPTWRISISSTALSWPIKRWIH